MNQRGQVTVMALGLVIVSFAVAGLAVDGTRAFLLRRSLQNAADAASLAGSGELNVGSYYGSGGKSLILDTDAARRASADILARRGVDAVVVVETTTTEVVVRLRSQARTMFLRLVGLDSIDVSVQARSAPVPGSTGD